MPHHLEFWAAVGLVAALGVLLLARLAFKRGPRSRAEQAKTDQGVPPGQAAEAARDLPPRNDG
ncbi:hypothetical protein [Phenylobacterium sp.]|uniref:hypothetical protein n=1 Tax=Phenylobacterium sp. TaxID=1871053 RepID=UPI00121CD151|nr:hypothetical protein [Phenylobacterium sp.]THD63640.1 MAG: hypothetical protein E8A49_04585 [Phenylobacterium sp.]